MAQIAFLVDKDGNIVLDDNGHPIPKDVADATSFNRSNVQPQYVPGLLKRMRNEVLRRSGYKLDSYGEALMDGNNQPIPIKKGHISGPILNEGRPYNINDFIADTTAIAQGRKISAEHGNQLVDL